MKDVIKKYDSVRKLHGDVLKILYNYYKKYSVFFVEQMQKFFLERTKNVSTAVEFADIKLNNESFYNFLTLYIYPGKHILFSVSQVVKNKQLIKKFDQKEMLESIINAKNGIYKPTSFDYNKKTIKITNVINGEVIEIVDVKLVEGIKKYDALNIYIVGRILTYQSINFMNNGIILDVDEESNELVKKAKKHNHTFADIYISALLYQSKYIK